MHRIIAARLATILLFSWGRAESRPGLEIGGELSLGGPLGFAGAVVQLQLVPNRLGLVGGVGRAWDGVQAGLDASLGVFNFSSVAVGIDFGLSTGRYTWGQNFNFSQEESESAVFDRATWLNTALFVESLPEPVGARIHGSLGWAHLGHVSGVRGRCLHMVTNEYGSHEKIEDCDASDEEYLRAAQGGIPFLSFQVTVPVL